jgi:hypothetical protein
LSEIPVREEAGNEYLELSLDQLSKEALQGIIENYITREGTDYGAGEYSLEQKVGQVMRQLQAAKAMIVYDPITESCTILPRD